MKILNSVQSSAFGKYQHGIEKMNEEELLAFLKNEENFTKEEKNMENLNSDFSATAPKPSIFRYFAKRPVPLDSSNEKKPNEILSDDAISSIPILDSKINANLSNLESFNQSKLQTLNELGKNGNVHSLNQTTHLNKFDDFLATNERVAVPDKLASALEELTSSVENIISNLHAQVDANQVWQPLVDGMKKMSEKRERLLEIEKMFDRTVDEMNALRESMCETLDGIKNSEIEIAKSLQARLQIASSLQEKLKTI